MTVFPAEIGAAIASVDIDNAVLNVLKKWLPTYLGIIEEKRSLTYKLPVPRASSYANTIDEMEFPDHSLPAVFVATARTEGTPEVMANGDNAVEWLVAVSALVRGRTPSETRTTASLYELAVRMALIQQLAREQRAANSFDCLCRWISGGEARPVADPNGRGRYLGEGSSQFGVFTNENVQEGVGPQVPDKQPYDDLATVQTVTEQIDGVTQLGG